MEDIVLLGIGGHAHSIVDSIEQKKQYNIVGFLDITERQSEIYRNYKVIGTDDRLQELYDRGVRNAFISVGYIGNGTIRCNLYEKIKEIGYQVPNIIDNTSIIASDVQLGEGIFVGKKVVINANSSIQDMCIINTGAIIEHDCRIKKYTHIAVGTVLCGKVSIGEECLIGANSTIIQGLTIGKHTIIGAAREPASPIIRQLGVALYQRYPRIHAMNSRIKYAKSGAISLLCIIRYTVASVMLASVPDRPSTPSAQFVTLIEPHTRITARIPYTTGFNVNVCPVSAMVISLPLKLT